MLLKVLKPRLFVSYARGDHELADALGDALHAQGCVTWMDRQDVLVGDDFVRDLSRELERQDGLVLLLTETSARSSWCHAEVQHAFARGMPIFVVQRDTESRLPDALERLLRDIQRVPWDVVRDGLGQQIRKARRRRWMRFTLRLVASFVVIAALAAAASFSVARINALHVSRRVDAFVNDLSSAAVVWSGEEVRSRVEPLRLAPGFVGVLRSISDDPARPATVRVNAWQALDTIQLGRQKEWRFHVPQIHWKDGRLADTLWANTTYGSGDITDLHASRVRMAGLVFGPGPTTEKSGMSVIGARIRDADVWFLRTDATQLIDVEFLNSKFRGAQLDLSGAAAFRILSSPPSDGIITPDVSVMEDSWIVRHNAPPEAGVLDLATPAQELLFEGVQFTRVRFEGHFKPEWFRNSHFRDCVFESALTAAVLTLGGNSEEGSVFLAR